MLSAYFETYGCSNNIAETEIMQGILARAGFIITNNKYIADIILINTCVVKGPTINKMIDRIKDLLKLKKPLLVAGCMPVVMAKEIIRLDKNISLISTHNINHISNVVRKVLEGKVIRLIDYNEEIKLNKPRIRKNSLIAIIPISSGCRGNCSFCFTYLAKKSLYSFPKECILQEIKDSVDSGCKEIWLTSQDCGAYGLDRGKRELPELLKEILKSKRKFFLRLGMMNPNNVKPILNKLIECYKDKKMFKFLHIPLQSGSDNVLEDMRRNYKSKDFIEIINGFRKEIPDIVVATDIICGYPIETEDDFQKTLDIIKQTKPDIININRFWPMPKTKAARLRQLTREEIKKRALKMSFLHKQIGLEKNKMLIGKTFKCIIDEYANQGMMGAKTMSYKQVLMKSGRIGDIIDAKITNCSFNYLIGEIC